ncbi:5-(carboxyamino)imidazole ribonucleotide mutase [Halothermothrix orenii]|uniref:N5-carboxyaminoimidazole ribonucleotide mutase n=1 Tax=Halothermothrix orenii (strain H 168 / OCM 544 / DSM 9562) TaxID=373903 RepID=B8D1A1_HALOH|nr:5-(carboxyamino)imidazole ribonucleotide mutase [Halothermothrix orenii]ACL71053.1 phosphoribosylaminoimidazole carboxylase, catalytic subunit [Halothermothrix orenii H 168]
MPDKKVEVGIVMGSDSDLPVMEDAAKFLDEMGIGYEMRVISAHRTPDIAKEYATSALDRGLKVIIAGAGKAAHLAGVLASFTPLPVIGVPVRTSTLGGADSLYSMVQMPSGVPVATVALNGAKNAAILALQIMATGDRDKMDKMIEFKKRLKKETINKDKNLKNKMS